MLITPYTSRWNGKVVRFFGAPRREWSHSRTWPNSTDRNRALSSWLRFYNRRRLHSAAGGRAPITRVQHVRGRTTRPGPQASRVLSPRRAAPVLPRSASRTWRGHRLERHSA